MGKLKYSLEFRQKISEKYLETNGDLDLVSKEFNVPKAVVKRSLIITGTTLPKDIKSLKKSQDMARYHSSLTAEEIESKSKRRSEISKEMWANASEEKRNRMINTKFSHSDEEILKIQELKSSGLKDELIAQQVGVKKSYIRSLFKKGVLVSPDNVRSINSAFKKYSDEEWDNIKKARESIIPVTYDKLTEIENKTKNQIMYMVRKSGIRINTEQRSNLHKIYKNEVIEKVIVLFKNQDLTYQQIADQLGLNLKIVRYILNKNNLGFKQQKLEKFGVSNYSELLQKIVFDHKGKLLTEYTRAHDPIQYICDKGHINDSRAYYLIAGHWCQYCPTIISKGHQEIIDYINLLGFNLKLGININNRSVIDRELDIHIPDILSLEYNGLYMHSFKYEGIKEKGANPGDHFNKYKMCEKANINLFTIFEDQWRDNKDLVKNMIKHRLGLSNAIKLNARDLKVEKFKDNLMVRRFFNKNHLKGYRGYRDAYGFFLDDKLIMCVTVGINRNRLEIGRMASDYDFNIRGGAGKLINAIKEDNINIPLYTHSDNCIGNGKVYENLGFKLINEEIGYSYTDGDIRLSRQKCSKIKDPEIIKDFPDETTQALGGVFSKLYLDRDCSLFKIEDCGNKTWVLQ